MSLARDLWTRMKELYTRKWELIDKKQSVWSEETGFSGLSQKEEQELVRVKRDYDSIWKEIDAEEKRNPTIWLPRRGEWRLK